MKSYRFRLATVTRIRALEERLARERYSGALRTLRESQDLQREAQRSLVSHELPSGTIAMAQLHWASEQAERLGATLRVCQEQVVLAQASCEQAGLAWQVATKRSNVLARLDEQGRATWREDLAREESAELDDLTTARYRRMRTSR